MGTEQSRAPAKDSPSVNIDQRHPIIAQIWRAQQGSWTNPSASPLPAGTARPEWCPAVYFRGILWLAAGWPQSNRQALGTLALAYARELVLQVLQITHICATFPL